MTADQMAKDLRHLLSDEANSRNPSPLKEAFKHFHDPNIISLGGGLPLPSLFPFDKLTVDVPKPPFENGIDYSPSGEPSDTVKIEVTKGPNGIDVPLQTSLQYGHSQGAEPLLEFLREHTRQIHSIPYKDWDLILSVGNTQSWDSTLRTFTNRGDTILAEEFTFSSAAECAHGLGVNIVPVKMDLNGVDPVLLEKQLDNWVGPKPKLFYTIPTGQNPTGSTLSVERRKAVYKLAQKHDFIIVEDEPYYFLQMPPFTLDPAQREKDLQRPSHEDFKNSLVQSYLNVDTDGRVIRLDSFSKILAPGSRVGWIVAQQNLLERYVRLHEVSIQTSSGFSQSIVYGLLQRWGQAGYIDWLIGLREMYSLKRNIAMDAVAEHLPKKLVDFVPPEAGMFFWIKLDARKHPLYSKLNENAAEVENHIYESGLKKGVQLIPGHWFVINDRTNPPQVEIPSTEDAKNAIYFRGTFASAPADKIVEALKRFGDHIREEFN